MNKELPPANGWVQPRGAVRTFGLELHPPAPRRLQPVVSPLTRIGKMRTLNYFRIPSRWA